MDFQAISREILNFTGTVNIWLVISLFIMLTLSEFGITIPYLMETIWILVGYHALTGALPVYFVAFLWVTTMAGRTAGALILYHLARFGGSWIMRFYRRIFSAALARKTAEADPASPERGLVGRLRRLINSLSPFSVAFGRLVWMRIPLTLTLGFNKKIKVLVPGVIISSMIWDTTYILAGVAGGGVQLEPFQVVLLSLAALTVIYGITFFVRWITRLAESRQVHKAIN